MNGSRPLVVIVLAIPLWAATSSAAEPLHPPDPAPAAPGGARTGRGDDRPPSTLTLGDLEVLALRGNPTLAQAEAVIEHSRAMAQQAGLYPNPTVGYVGEQINADRTAGEMQGGFLQQRIVTAGKLRLSRAKYDQATTEAEIRAHAQRLRVVNSVHLRYFELLADQCMIGVRAQLLKNAEEALRTHREMHNTGQASQADVLLQEVEVGRARVALRAVENQLLAHWQHLTALLGCPELPLTPLAGHLEANGPPLEWDKSLARLVEESPELHLAHAHVVFDQITLKRECVQKVPDIQIQAAAGRNFETSNTVASVQVGVQVPLFDWNQGTVRQVKADLARSVAEVTRVELSLRKRLAEAFQDYDTAWQAVRIYHDVNLPKTAEAYRIYQDMYEKRRIGWPKVVELERTLLLVKSEYTHKLLELRKAEVLICGLLLVDGLTESPPATPGGHLEATPKPR